MIVIIRIEKSGQHCINYYKTFSSSPHQGLFKPPTSNLKRSRSNFFLFRFPQKIGPSLVMDRYSKQDFRVCTRNQPKYGFKEIMAFLKFLPNSCQFFAIFDDFSKFSSTFGALQFEKSSNIAKNEEKPCSPTLQHISTIYTILLHW